MPISTITSALALITTLHACVCTRGPLVDTSSLSQTIITVDLSSNLHNNMSTANKAISKSTATPWADWKLDSEFLSEINKYCDNHNKEFFDIIEAIIKGIGTVEEILVYFSIRTPNNAH